MKFTHVSRCSQLIVDTSTVGMSSFINFFHSSCYMEFAKSTKVVSKEELLLLVCIHCIVTVYNNKCIPLRNVTDVTDNFYLFTI